MIEPFKNSLFLHFASISAISKQNVEKANFLYFALMLKRNVEVSYILFYFALLLTQNVEKNQHIMLSHSSNYTNSENLSESCTMYRVHFPG